jgi:hypothetical protein
MAITVSNATIESAREYETYQKHLKNSPKLYRFTYMLGGEQMKTSILAPDEKSACLLFNLLAAENGGDIRVENQEYMGICDFMTPDLQKVYKKKLSMAVYDKFYAILKQENERQEKQAQAEVENRKAEKSKTREAKINHALDILAQAAAYARKLGLAKAQREKEQDADFSRWMKIKDGNNNQ